MLKWNGLKKKREKKIINVFKKSIKPGKCPIELLNSEKNLLWVRRMDEGVK
jgi:hypothetical protein